MSDEPVTIVVKYCGGCNPLYDRVALVRRLEERLFGTARFVPAGGRECKGDLLLVVCGCHVRCAGTHEFSDLPTVFIDRPEGVTDLVKRIRAMPDDAESKELSEERGKIYGRH
ncbi:MAG: hypothetical protein JW885_02365 [Deltaproteobacteria bacterium]|nr:hypothetical protein [Candidatus Zymogenaceae bacterium]